MSRGRNPNMHEKLAAALLALRRLDPATGALVPLVARELAAAMSPKEIIRLFEFDHKPVPKALGGSNHPTNLIPTIKPEHREVTAQQDIPTIAKVKRAAMKHEEFRRRILAKTDATVEAPPRRPSRLKSRGFQGHRKFNGEIVRK